MTNIAERVNWMEREEIVQVLEQYGFACHDSESTDELRDALRTNVEDKTIDESDIPDKTPSSADRSLRRLAG